MKYFKEGAAAYGDGKDVTDNPYRAGSYPNKQWDSGFISAWYERTFK